MGTWALICTYTILLEDYVKRKYFYYSDYAVTDLIN